MSEQTWPWPERYSCDGDEYHDTFDDDGFVSGARPCQGCPSCQPELADAAAASSGDTETAT